MINTFIHKRYFDTLQRYKNYKEPTRYVPLEPTYQTVVEQYAAGLSSALETNNASIHCLSVLGNIQHLAMDKVSWNARKLFNANAPSRSRLENDGALWGMEATERVREFVGVDADNEDQIVQQTSIYSSSFTPS